MSESSSMLAQSGSVLEWDRVRETLAQLAGSVLGAEQCRHLTPEPTLPEALSRMAETEEAVRLRQEGTPLPTIVCPDVRASLGRAAKGAVLDAHELHDVAIVLGVAFEVHHFLARRAGDRSALGALAAPLALLSACAAVKAAIDRAIDEDGSIKESATPELRGLMHHAHELKQQMRRRLDVILASTRYAEVLQEHYFDQRDGRYVVPVKAEMRSKIPGIIHDVSTSGATVFLEPRELVELNNTIKVAELAVDREVRRILSSLSSDVSRIADDVTAALTALAALDCVAAKARLSERIGGHAVRLNAEGRIALRQARHPLLVLTKEGVVANDVVMDESVRVLILSGPNTGGKTVTLKMLGLFALMVRAGLQPSCAPDSDMAFFQDVYADIGDTQDLTKDLSSFSAHMTQMIDLLGRAEAIGGVGGASALVLLDEPVTSTDPAEGAALAEALLVRLAQLGMKVVATTHYNSLKALAHTTPGFQNASVGFDIATLSPTYRLLLGVPGGSSAIEIAGRLGMDESILDDALARLKREDRAMERMLGDLQDKQHRLEEDERRMAAMKEEAEAATRQAQEIAERLSATERDERKRMRARWSDELRRARSQIQAVLDELQATRTLEKAKEVKRRLADLDERLTEAALPPRDRVPLETLKAGDAVELIGLDRTGTLLEAPPGKKRVRVRVGDREMSVAASSLRGIATPPDRADSAPAGQPSGRFIPAGSGTDVTSTVLDLRGQTAEEALAQTIAALDQAAVNQTPIVRVIHGHGTGRLKTMLRNYFKESPYVARFRPGERSEGGDGITIVELA